MHVYKEGENIVVSSPYNAEFVKEANRLNGIWKSNNKTWLFNLKEEEAVLSALKKSYGSISGCDYMNKKEIISTLKLIVDSNSRPLNCKIDKDCVTIFEIGNGLCKKSKSIRFDLSDNQNMDILIDLVDLSPAVMVADIVTTFEQSRVVDHTFVGMFNYSRVTVPFLKMLVKIIDGSIYKHDVKIKINQFIKQQLNEFLNWYNDKDHSFMFRGIRDKYVRLKDKHGNDLIDWKIEEIKELLEHNEYKVISIEKITRNNQVTDLVICKGFAVTSSGVAFAYD
ncbi:hypothetical protein CI088_01365 [Enterococcus plantarum]|uniref:Uncharacterized protein n=1 Tax=Enterococcus plantarum TaxID=1077675 RepID=A0A2W3ZCL0_9ENTE|nr:hypothetical protein [Enterococcus plantarum]PZL77478.1 hypothetical protein CI088_01365 [Enterococcus plantarum]